VEPLFREDLRPTQKASSLAVSSPSAFCQYRRATYPRREPPHPSYGAFSAFRTLSRPSSFRYLPALFHAGAALGVSPRGPFLLLEPSFFSEAVPSCDFPMVAFAASACVGLELPRTYELSAWRQPLSEAAIALPWHASGPSSPRATVSLAELFRRCKVSRPSTGLPSLGLSPFVPVTFLGVILS